LAFREDNISLGKAFIAIKKEGEEE